MESWHRKGVLRMIPSPDSRFRWSPAFAGSKSHKMVPLPFTNTLTTKLITAVSKYRTAHPVRWLMALLLLIWTIFAADIATGRQVSLSILYLIPISLATWQYGGNVAILVSFVCATACGAVDVLAGNTYSSITIPVWNAAVRCSVFLLVAYMLETLSSALEWARTDVLTGILNVRGFREQSERELARCARDGHGFSLVYFDLDNFKAINDRLGHRYGDAALRRVGTVLERCLRRTDIAARIGGDEFVVLFPATNYRSATSAVAKLDAELKRAFADTRRPITFSIGVGTFDFVPESLEFALSEADALMYVSKRSGKNKVTHRQVARIRTRGAQTAAVNCTVKEFVDGESDAECRQQGAAEPIPDSLKSTLACPPDFRRSGNQRRISESGGYSRWPVIAAILFLTVMTSSILLKPPAKTRGRDILAA